MAVFGGDAFVLSAPSGGLAAQAVPPAVAAEAQKQEAEFGWEEMADQVPRMSEAAALVPGPMAARQEEAGIAHRKLVVVGEQPAVAR
jgi:hypothetical protein